MPPSTHTHTNVTSPPRADPNFLTHFTAKGNHQYFNGQHLACEVLTRMYVNLTRSELLFIYKMVPEIISIPRADSGYPHNFMVDSWVSKDDESESEVKTNSGPRLCPLLVESPHFVCVEHAHFLLLAHCVSACTHTHTHTHTHTDVTSPPRADLNFLTHFTAKDGPSMFQLSTLSM